MTVEVELVLSDLPFKQVKQRVAEKVDEVEEEKDGEDLNTDEKLKIARDMLGYFTVEELAEATPDVSMRKTRDKISYWESIGEVERRARDAQGALIYILPELE